jgi:hypothetical protein
MVRTLAPALFALALAVLRFATAAAVVPAATEPPASAASPAVTGGWERTVQKRIADAEYEITWSEDAPAPAGARGAALSKPGGSWQAPNRAHGLRTYFMEDGIRVIPRSEPSSWEWSLALRSWGRPAADPADREDASASTREPLASVQFAAAGARATYDRGAILEWYVNDRRGLEQGFTLAAPPRAKGSRVEIDLALGGTLAPVVAQDGQAIDFATPQGARVLHYGSLSVRDADGRALRAWMEAFADPVTAGTANAGDAATSDAGETDARASGASGGGIRIVFEDADAIYPVTVDPLATSAAWSVESDQADAFFGAAVATAGDVNGDGFSDVIVGAWRYDDGSSDEGRAFVYLGSASGPSTNPAWSFESNQQDAHLGKAVGTAGDINNDGYSDVIVGAEDFSNGNLREGKVFLFRGSASGLEATPFWTAEANQDAAGFGCSVGTAGDVNNDGLSDVMVGAFAYGNGVLNEGAAFVYYGTISGPSLAPSWTASGGISGAGYGISTGTAGDVDGDGYSDVIVGAFRYTNGQNQEGKAYVYRGSASGLSTTPVWTFEANQAGASLGKSVGTAGDVNGDGYADIIVGSSGYTNGESIEGRALVFYGGAAGPALSPSWSVKRTRRAPRWATRSGRRGTSTATGTPTSSSALRATTTARATRGARPSTSGPRRG